MGERTMYPTINIDWKGELTPEVMQVAQIVAARHLKHCGAKARMHFGNDTCAGFVERKNETVIGTYAGTVYRVEMSTVSGSEFMYEFLLPRGAADVILDESALTFGYRFFPGGLELSLLPKPENAIEDKDFHTVS